MASALHDVASSVLPHNRAQAFLCSCRPNDTDILDAVFVSRPEDLSDLEDILPSLDDVLNPHADFASDSELPLWDSMLSTLSCPGMQSIDSQSMAQGLPAYGHGKGQDSNKAVAGPQAQLPSASNSACSCDAQQAIEWQTASQQGIESSPAQVHAQCPVQPQTGKSPDEPASSRDSNPCAASPESASDKAAGSKKRKVDDSDEDCSGRHPSPSSGTTQVPYDGCTACHDCRTQSISASFHAMHLEMHFILLQQFQSRIPSRLQE